MERGIPSAKAFQPPPGLIAQPADGAPALHPIGGAELDDHLKVGSILPAVSQFSYTTILGSITRPRIPSKGPPYS